MTVVSILRLNVREGGGEELARKFAELEVFEHSRRSGAFRGGRLLRPLEGDGPYAVVAEWDNAESYQRWLDNPVRAELGEQLEQLMADEVAPGELYQEV